MVDGGSSADDAAPQRRRRLLLADDATADAAASEDDDGDAGADTDGVGGGGVVVVVDSSDADAAALLLDVPDRPGATMATTTTTTTTTATATATTRRRNTKVPVAYSSSATAGGSGDETGENGSGEDEEDDGEDEDDDRPNAAGGGLPTPTPVPWRKVVTLSLLFLCEALAITFFWPFVGRLVESYGVPLPEVGYAAGAVGSAWSLAQFCSGFFWGRMSDRIGRRPIMIASLLGNAVCTAAFGMTGSVAAAVALRFASGALSANIVTAKTVMREITDETNQARCFSAIGAVWAAGIILGPILGGFTSRPADNSDFFASMPLFVEHPYLLPCLIVALVNLIGCLGAICFLQETLQNRVPLRDVLLCRDSSAPSAAARAQQQTGSEDVELLRAEAASSEDDDDREEQEQEPPAAARLVSADADTAVAALADDDADGDVVADDDGVAVLQVPAESRQRSTGGGCCAALPRRLIPCRSARSYSALDDEAAEGQKEEEEEEEPTAWKVIRQPAVALTVLGYILIAFVHTALDEGFALFAIQSREMGGLDYTEANVATVTAVAGAGFLIFQLFIYARLDRRFGTLALFRFGGLPLPVVVFLLPFTSDLPEGLWASVAVVVLVLIRFLCAVTTFSSVMLLINNSAPPSHVGAVNGASTSLAALTRCTAPFIGGAVLSASLSDGGQNPFPFNMHAVFVLVALIAVAASVVAFKLPASLAVRRS